MNKATKLTLDELMRRKEQILAAKKKKEKAVLYIPSLDANITIEEPTAELVNDALEMDKGDGDRYLIYHCIVEPKLKDNRIQEEFNCTEPTDIVDMLFKPGEIPMIAVEAMKLAGYIEGIKNVETIKN